MEYAIAAIVIGGFAYFVYTRVRKSRKGKPSGGSGGGGAPSREHIVREEVQ